MTARITALTFDCTDAAAAAGFWAGVVSGAIDGATVEFATVEQPDGALAHTDGFATVGETYRLLGAWVAHNATPEPDGSICERYPHLDGRTEGSDSTIEIRWPLSR